MKPTSIEKIVLLEFWSVQNIETKEYKNSNFYLFIWTVLFFLNSLPFGIIKNVNVFLLTLEKFNLQLLMNCRQLIPSDGETKK